MPWDSRMRESHGTVVLEEELFLPSAFRSTPDHAGLFLGTEPQFFVEPRPPRTEPEEFNPLQPGMVENALDDVCSDALLLIRFVDDNIPNRGAIDKVRQHSPESDQLIAIPRAERYVRMSEHFPSILQRPFFGPGSLMEKLEELLRLNLFLFRKNNGGLEGRRHLVLQYPLASDWNDSPSVRGIACQRKSVAARSASNLCG